MSVATARRVEDIPALSHDEWIAIGAAENAAMLRLLRSLDPDDWAAPTDCALWSVKDIAAHVLGNADGFTSFRELRHQLAGSMRRRKELGNPLNAMNQTQIDDRRYLSVDELLARLDEKLPAFIKVRDRLGRFGRAIPFYDPSVLGFTNLRYLTDTIYPRDVLMHRIDITRATGKELELLDEHRLLVADVIRDWARRVKPDVRLELSGSVGAVFEAGAATTSISADAVEFCRVLSGRGESSGFSIDGDTAAAQRWIAAGCPF